MQKTLTLAQAQAIIEGALARSKVEKFKPMAIAVLDESGNLKAFAREDGASMFRFEVAQAKAWGAPVVPWRNVQKTTQISSCRWRQLPLANFFHKRAPC